MSRLPLSSTGFRAVAAAVLLSAACEVTVDSGPYTVHEEKRFRVTGITTLSLTTFDGSLEVRSWDRDEVLIEVEKRGPDKEQAEAIQVRAEQAGSTITIDVKRPDGRQRPFGIKASPSARIVASVPRSCNLVARSGDGSIRVERVTGKIELRTADGGVRGIDLAGSLVVHTGSGSLRFDDVEGTVDLESGDGGARLTGKLQAVRVRTGDGSVEVRADEGSAMSSEWEIRTGDGGLRIELPAGFSANLDASTGDGVVRLRGFGEPDAPGRRERTSSVQRSLNSGGRVIRLRSDSGSITVKTL
jgi:DUF4097 and DUF4098 domain-containing protein YvlB